MKKIAILTGGGDCPGLNAVIRSVVKTAINKYGYEVYGFKDGYKGLVLNEYVRLTSNDVSGIIDRGGTILGTSNKDTPFSFKVETNGKVEYLDMSNRVIENLNNLGITSLIIVGGDGTMINAQGLHKLGVNVIGIPKTIDNDLPCTEITFGFMTAIETATDAIDKLHSTADSHHRIMVLEVMGRYAGWIALESGLAGGADVILIPEIPYDIKKVAKSIVDRKNAGKNFSIVVVGEGAKNLDGEMVVSQRIIDSPDPIRLGGIGNVIGKQLEELTGIEARVTVLGHLQRGGRTGAFDRILSTRFGVEAVNLIDKGNFGQMVALRGASIVSVSLTEATGSLKLVDPNGELVKMGKSCGVDFGD